MTKDELLGKAIYIQYPLKDGTYKKFSIPSEKINKLPNGDKYDGWKNNEHHFTTEYHRNYSIPLYCKLFGLDYDENDFILEERKSGKYDLSFLKPKKEYKYEIFGYTRGEHFDNLGFDDISYTDLVEQLITDYHRLYKYPHECSRVINKIICNERKLFISGDSQMIPDISFLSCFFQEVWYFDNRKKKTLSNNWVNENFTDVLIEVGHLPLTDYTELNFK